MDSNKIAKNKAKNPNFNSERREFLRVAKKFSAVVVTLGLASVGLAGKASGENDPKPVQQLLQYAIKTGNMELAIQKYGKAAKLTEVQLKALKSITQSELQTLQTIKQKLSPLKDRIDSLKLLM